MLSLNKFLLPELIRLLPASQTHRLFHLETIFISLSLRRFPRGF